MAIALAVIIVVVLVCAIRVALFRRAAIGARARTALDRLSPIRRMARRRRSGR